MRKGDVVLVRFPFSDFESEKVRPAVVLVPENSYGDVCVAFITSRMVREPDCVFVEAGKKGFAKTGLKVSSTIRAGKIVTLQVSLITLVIGSLPPSHLAELNRVLKQVFKL
jgi:mRNA interferase MazF